MFIFTVKKCKVFAVLGWIEAATSGHSQALIEDAFATSASVATQQMLVVRPF
jgi:hypothetical protein